MSAISFIAVPAIAVQELGMAVAWKKQTALARIHPKKVAP